MQTLQFLSFIYHSLSRTYNIFSIFPIFLHAIKDWVQTFTQFVPNFKTSVFSVYLSPERF